MDQQTLHIIYNGTQVLLSKRPWSSWKEIQSAYADYKASLGPWSSAEATLFLQDEYADLKPSVGDQVRALEASSAETITLTFANE